jgi:hypothetical protein
VAMLSMLGWSNACTRGKKQQHIGLSVGLHRMGGTLRT